MCPATQTNTPTRSPHLAVQALAEQGRYGAVTRLAHEYGVSRQTVYKVREQAEQALRECFEDPTHDDKAVMVRVDRRQLQRAMIGLRVISPVSLPSIEELIPILYPGVQVSYGTVQGELAQAGERAEVFNRTQDLSSIRCAAADELFSQSQPVLAALDLESSYLFALQLESARGGEEWARLLRRAQARGAQLDMVVKDAALGLEKGVREVYPEAEQRDDLFHPLRDMGRVLRWMERKAYAQIGREVEAEEALAKHTRGSRGSLGQKLRRARERTNKVLDAFDAFEKACHRARDALQFIDWQKGRWRDPETMKSELVAAAESMQQMNGVKVRKLGRYLENRAEGLVLWAREVAAQLSTLSESFGEDATRMACLLWHAKRTLERTPADKRSEKLYGRMYASLLGLNQSTTPESAALLYKQVDALLWRRHRASSAIEGFNAQLRPHLYVHRGVQQSFLELFRAAYNLRSRRSGRFKGISPYERLTGRKVEDWLTLLGYPPTPSS